MFLPDPMPGKLETKKRNWKKIIIRNALGFIISLSIIVLIIYCVQYFGR